MAKGTLQLLLGTLARGDYPGLYSCIQCSHKGPYKGKREAGGSVRDVMTEQSSERFWGATELTLKQREGPLAKDYKLPLEAGQEKKTDAPLEPPEGMQFLL